MPTNVEKLPNRRMTFDEFFSYIQDTYLTPGKLYAFLTNHSSLVTEQALLETLQSELVTDQLRKQWDYERSDQWSPQRSGETAAFETMQHGFGHLLSDMVLVIEGKRQTVSIEEAKDLETKLDLLAQYFRKEIPFHRDEP